MPTSTINGVRLFWELTGSSGEPVVLVHGSWNDHTGWDLVAPSLSQSFRVLTYDRRGHSQSERPTAPGSIEDDVADLAALIEALDLAPAHIVGSSFGGSVVLRLAAARPDLFQSLIVQEAPLLDLLAAEPDGQTMIQAMRTQLAAIGELLAAGDMEAGASTFVETIAFGPGMWDKLPDKERQSMLFNAPTFLDEMRDLQAFSLDLARLSGFPHPVLLTRGEHSAPFFRPIVEQVAAALPQAERKTYAGADHMPHQSHPELYTTTVAEFITRVTGHVRVTG